MRFLFQAIFMLTIASVCISVCMAKLESRYEWKYIDYDWNDDAQKEDAIAHGEYNHMTIIPTDFHHFKDGSDMIVTPRYDNNPASLSLITNKTGDGGPLLAPYPDWSWHTKGNCSGITSVSRVFVDAYEKLWLVDTGRIKNDQVCPAKILKFDVETKELLLQVEIPYNLTHSPTDESKSQLEIQAVEMTGHSNEHVWVYISDLEGFGLIIWDGEDIWRLDDEVFRPTSDSELFSIDGENVTILGGPQGLLLTPPEYLEQTYLIMKPLSSIKTFAATTDDLHESKSGNKVAYYRSNFTAPSQEPGKVFTKTGGILIAGFTTEMALACWNIQNPLEEDYVAVLEVNSTTLQYISSIRVTQEEKGAKETVWVLSNRYQKYLLGTMNFDEVNYRVQQADVNSLVAGTGCEPRAHGISKTIEEKDFFYYKTS